jgi:hypothetical protein
MTNRLETLITRRSLFLGFGAFMSIQTRFYAPGAREQLLLHFNEIVEETFRLLPERDPLMDTKAGADHVGLVKFAAPACVVRR